MRTLVASTLLLCSGGLFTGCFKHHMVDEQVFELVDEAEADAGPDDQGEGDAGKTPSTPEDAGGGDDCADITDTVSRFLCMAGLGGDNGGGGGLNIEDIIRGILGGGADMGDCSKETDPFARLLCQATSGGGGLEGIIGDLLGGGGGLLGDGGIERILIGTFSEVIRGIIDDLFQGLIGSFGGNGAEDGEMGSMRGRGTMRGALLNVSALNGSELPEPTEAECAAVHPDDLLTRLQCARKALDALDRSLSE